MPRLEAVDPSTATGKSKELLDGIQAKLGMTPNILRAGKLAGCAGSLP